MRKQKRGDIAEIKEENQSTTFHDISLENLEHRPVQKNISERSKNEGLSFVSIASIFSEDRSDGSDQKAE